MDEEIRPLRTDRLGCIICREKDGTIDALRETIAELRGELSELRLQRARSLTRKMREYSDDDWAHEG